MEKPMNSDADRAARAAPQPATADAELLDFIEKHPEKWLRYRKGKWAFLGFTNYEFDMHPTLREAIAASARGLVR